MRMATEKLREAFVLVGEMLVEDGVSGEILVYGGTVEMLQMAYRDSADGVDCDVNGGRGNLMRAVIAAGRRLGLPDGWLDEAASAFRSGKEDASGFFPFGQYPNARRPVLKVVPGRPQYLLAMKIEALNRQHPRDMNDVTMLARDLGFETADEMLSVHQHYFEDADVTPEIKSSLRQIERAVKTMKDEEARDARL